MKSNYFNFFFSALSFLFILGTSLQQVDAQVFFINPKTTLSEIFQSDGVKLETIHFFSPNGSKESETLEFTTKVIITPVITLSQNDKMIISLDDAPTFFYFYADSTLITSKPSSPSKALSPENPFNAPWYEDGSDWFYSTRYCKVWVPQGRGQETLHFYGEVCSPRSWCTIHLEVPVVIL